MFHYKFGRDLKITVMQDQETIDSGEKLLSMIKHGEDIYLYPDIDTSAAIEKFKESGVDEDGPDDATAWSVRHGGQVYISPDFTKRLNNFAEELMNSLLEK